MRILCIILLVCNFFFGYSQSNELDSLLSILEVSPNDNDKVDLLNDIAYKTSLINLDTSFNYATRALDLATDLSYESGKARALNIQSNKHLQEKENLESILINNEALLIARRINDHANLCRIYNSIAVNYYNMGDQENAIKNLQLSADAAQLDKDTTKTVFILTNVGYLHLQNEDLDLAEKYLLEAKEFADIVNTQSSQKIVAKHLGSLYAAQDNYELSVDYLKQAIELSRLDNDPLNQALSQAELGNYLSRKNEFKEAEANLLEGLSILEDRNYLANQLEVNVYLAEHYNRKKDYTNAIKVGLQSLDKINENDNSKHKASYLEQLSIAYEGIGDTKSAFKYFKLYKETNDIIQSTQSMDKVLDLESKYQFEKKDVENKLLVEEKAKKEEIITRRNFTIFATLFLLLLLAIIAMLLWRTNIKEQRYSLALESEVQARTLDLQTTNKKLSQSNEELERFAYIASHDLKEPVRNIISFTELLEKEIGNDSSDKAKNFMKIIHDNSRLMFSLIRDTLEYSKIEREETAPEPVDLNMTIRNIKSTISDTIQRKNAQIEIAKPLPVINSNETQLFIVLKNLIENGLKYNESKNPRITIDYRLKGQEYIFSVEDNGIGVNPKHYDRIFEMYKRLQKKEGWEGTGLGLATCKKIVQQLGGIIWIDSKLGEGSTFYFSLPINHSTLAT